MTSMSISRRAVLTGAGAVAIAGSTGRGSATPAFPICITHSRGELVLPAPPKRIVAVGYSDVADKAPERAVSVGQNSTEILLSLGLAPKMVGPAVWVGPVLENLKEANDKVPRISNNLAAALADRYPEPAVIPQLVRVYVRRDQRGRGIGRWFRHLSEAEAARLGFGTLYLHASASTPATLQFWRNQGFVEFANADDTAHFDKALDSKKGLARSLA